MFLEYWMIFVLFLIYLFAMISMRNSGYNEGLHKGITVSVIHILSELEKEGIISVEEENGEAIIKGVSKDED
jgi:hypothetical protein